MPDYIGMTLAMKAFCGLLSLVLIGCLEEASPVMEAAPYAPATSYCERTVDAFCAFYLRCGWMAVPDETACRARFLETCSNRYQPLYVAMENAGLLRLSNAGLVACASHLDAVACAAYANDLQWPCSLMWEGQQPEGGACGIGSAGIENMVCAPGTRCVLGMTLCGTCEATAPLGADCLVDSDCQVTAACVDDRCLARAVLGGSCADLPCVSEARCEQQECVARHLKGGVGATCASVLDCQYTLACVGQECVPAVPLGDSCDASTPCDGGYCAGVCEVLSLPGAACSDAAECISGGCDSVCATVPGACF